MATVIKLKSGSWRVQVRKQGRYLSRTFRLKGHADAWAREIETMIDAGTAPVMLPSGKVRTVAHLIDLHLQDLREIGKPLRRSKQAVMEALRRDLGPTLIKNLDRHTLIQFGRKRAKEGAGPVTLAVDFSYLRTVLTHAAAIHGIAVDTESIALARTALTRLGLIGRSDERDRRPSEEELDLLIEHFDNTPAIVPMARIVRFAVATAMRQEEICRITWDDVNFKTKIVTVKDRKDPRKKDGNHQKVPLLNLSGIDAWQLLLEQKILTGGRGRVFPYNSKSVGAAFRRGRKAVGIDDVRFHDLRHEATSRFFEAGLRIEQVALITGHKDWKMLRRYTHLKPEALHALQDQSQAAEHDLVSKLIE
ncbi:MAG: site-specific integrase [Pseudomonadota bacterium]